MQKIKSLEGLRGIAALIVFFGHLKYTSFLAEYESITSYIHNLPMFYFLKVMLTNTLAIFFDVELAIWVFWFLSSYVISILFFKASSNYDKILIGYFSKRYFRLVLPVLASVAFAYILLKLGLTYNHQLAHLQGTLYVNGWLNSFYNFEPDLITAIQSAVFDTFFNYQGLTTYNASLWTIQSEYLGSLFTFSLFGIVKHNSQRFLIYVLILVVLLKLQLFWLCAFLIGHVLCDYDYSESNHTIIVRMRGIEQRLNRFKLPIFIGSLLFVILGRNILTFIKIPPELHSLILSIFVVYMCLRSEYLKNIFSTRIPVWLGKNSFSMYLIHLPLICSLTCFLILTSYSLLGKVTACFITMIVLLVASNFFTKYIDKNSIVLANRIGDYFKRKS
ncbi:MAG TPA: acyltransferase [Cyclobacteriaceae bacterium]|nr:acyltransferase [Cyclobacteriaceae bacterium]